MWLEGILGTRYISKPRFQSLLRWKRASACNQKEVKPLDDFGGC
jgi:hypothetical protein